MMKTSLRVDPRRHLVYAGAMLCAALAFSYLEAILPLSFVIPLPGVKLGLANLAVMLAFFCLSPADSAIVSFARVFLSALLFGSPISFFFSLLGGMLAYFSLFLTRPMIKRGKISFIGASAISSALHSLGQIFAASVVYGVGALFYLPVILICSLPFGVMIGWLLNLLYPKMEKIIYENKK